MKLNSEFLNNLNTKYLDGKTLLCLGPMSQNSYSAIKESSQNSSLPLTVIASRNQIECKSLGGGYVNNWNTQSFLYMTSNDSDTDNIFIGRDHAGPFLKKHSETTTQTDDDALKEALESIKTDIQSGTKFIHLDPSKYTKGSITIDGMINCLTEMYAQCNEFANSNNKEVFYEIGGEGHGPQLDDPKEVEYFLEQTMDFIGKHQLKKPTFCVAKLGSYVREDKNIGEFKTLIQKGETDPITRIVEIIHGHDIMVKQHNVDYLDFKTLSQIPKLGIDAINIAPQLGYLESAKLIEILRNFNLKNEEEELFEIVQESGNWKTWSSNELLDEAIKTKISAHYIYSTERFKQIKSSITLKVPSIDEILINELTSHINQVIKALNLGK